MQNPEVSRLGQISLTVTDLERSKVFYRNSVGLTFQFEAQNMAFFDCGGVRIMVTTSQEGKSPANSILYFVVEDIDHAHAAMVERGVSFVREPHMLAKMPDHELWMAFFHDPDENVMALMCEKR